MKHTILTCAKFKRLKHRLSNHMECTVIGALESLFLYAGANGPVMSASDVEAICGWTCGEDGVLLDALTDTGDGAYTNFLDVLPDGKVEIHDFWDHAPDCVKTRERQRAYREAKRNAVSHDSHTTVTRQSRSCNDKPNQTKPNQVCIRETNVSLVDGAPKKTRNDSNPNFNAFWQAYPRRVAKGAAQSAWKKMGCDKISLQTFLDAIDQAKRSAQWKKDNGQFIPHPATWLNQRRWEDEPEAAKDIYGKEVEDDPDYDPFG